MGRGGLGLDDAESRRPVSDTESEELGDREAAPEALRLTTALPLRETEGLLVLLSEAVRVVAGEAERFALAVKSLLGDPVPDAVGASPEAEGEDDTVATVALALVEGEPQEEGLRERGPVPVPTREAVAAAVAVSMLALGVTETDMEVVAQPLSAVDGVMPADMVRPDDALSDAVAHTVKEGLRVPDTDGGGVPDAAPDAELVVLIEGVKEPGREPVCEAELLRAPVVEPDSVRVGTDVRDTVGQAPLVRVALSTRVEDTVGEVERTPDTLGEPDTVGDTEFERDPVEEPQGVEKPEGELLSVLYSEAEAAALGLPLPELPPLTLCAREEVAQVVMLGLSVGDSVAVMQDVAVRGSVAGAERLMLGVGLMDRLGLTVPLREGSGPEGLAAAESDSCGEVVKAAEGEMTDVSVTLEVADTGSVKGAEGEMLLERQTVEVMDPVLVTEAQGVEVPPVEPEREAVEHVEPEGTRLAELSPERDPELVMAALLDQGVEPEGQMEDDAEDSGEGEDCVVAEAGVEADTVPEAAGEGLLVALTRPLALLWPEGEFDTLTEGLIVGDLDCRGDSEGAPEAVAIEPDGVRVIAALAVITDSVGGGLGVRSGEGDTEGEPDMEREPQLDGDGVPVTLVVAAPLPLKDEEGQGETEGVRDRGPDALGLDDTVPQREGTRDALALAVVVPPSREKEGEVLLDTDWEGENEVRGDTVLDPVPVKGTEALTVPVSAADVEGPPEADMLTLADTTPVPDTVPLARVEGDMEKEPLSELQAEVDARVEGEGVLLEFALPEAMEPVGLSVM